MRQIVLVFSLTTALLLTGTLGFHLVDGWPLFDSFYMSLTTLTTVGYQEIRPLMGDRSKMQQLEKALEA